MSTMYLLAGVLAGYIIWLIFDEIRDRIRERRRAKEMDAHQAMTEQEREQSAWNLQIFRTPIKINDGKPSSHH